MAFSAHGRDTSHFYSPPSNFDEYPWKISKLKAPFNYIRRIERQSIRYPIRIHIILRVSFKLLSSLQKHHNWYKIIFILENDNCKHLLEKKKTNGSIMMIIMKKKNDSRHKKSRWRGFQRDSSEVEQSYKLRK